MKKILLPFVFICLMFTSCENSFREIENAERGRLKTAELLNGMNFYYGNLHSHTKYSDGKGTPHEVLNWAREKAEYDFYAITDHAFAISQEEWYDTGVQCEKHTVDGEFIAIRGFEWTQMFRGHISVFNTRDYRHVFQEFSLGNFYSWVVDQGGLAQLNHPGRDMPGDFNGSKIYKQRHIPNVFAMETGNKNDGNNDGDFEYYFNKSLDKGWKIAPTNNQDNHSMVTNTHRTVVISEKLTLESLFDAMRKRRVYSSDDPNMKVVYKYGRHWMGSELSGRGNKKLTIDVSDDETITKIEIVSNGGLVVASKDFNSEHVFWEPTVKVTGEQYFYAKIYEINSLDEDEGNKRQITLTAPIWFN